ncbi:Major facilitator family transporter [Pseudomonas avellanae]|uniref:Major facilitator family transporter n=1 Tax=Pseudomonas avellanae TaxID=46257 RepID=A0A3M5T9H6_9PSED|nr:Major facilitator family transporter [Pseudomonas avellanae]GGJ45340.1 hypothetical protein GCM10009085_43730 [Pseudomonas avellanae]
MPLSLLILALSAFAIGTTEFVIMGLLPDVAADLGVSIPGAGWLVTGYALGVAVGAPFMAMATAKLPRKAAQSRAGHADGNFHHRQPALRAGQ